MNRAKVLRILRWIAYPFVYLVTFAIGLSVFFPFDAVKQRQVDLFNVQQRTGQRLSIERLDSYWVTGLRVQKLKLSTPSVDSSKPPTELQIDEVTARLQILHLFIGKRIVKFDAAVMGGTVTGSLELGSKERVADIVAKGLALGDVTPLTRAIGLPAEGTLGGVVHLQMPEGKASKANGTLKFELADMALGDGKTGLGLPKFTIGTLPIEAAVTDGVVKIARFSVSGKDLDLQGEGKLTLADNSLNDAKSDMSFRFRFSESYKGKNEQTKSLLQGPRSLLEMTQSPAKTPEGYFGQSMSGALADPKFVPNNQLDAILGKGKK